MTMSCRAGFLAALFYLVLAGAGLPTAVSGAELPADSYYQLDVPLETQAAGRLRFSDMSGAPAIVAMFYASCPHVCPMTISTIRAIEDQLPAKERERLRILMVTFDPDRDTPDALAELADRHHADNARWRFARTVPADIRPVAAVLGIRYRKLPDGSFNHASPIVLLDREGREIARTEKLGRPDPAFVEAVSKALQSD